MLTESLISYCANDGYKVMLRSSMVKTIQISTEATENEINQLKKRSGKSSVKEALNDAMQYFIQHKEIK